MFLPRPNILLVNSHDTGRFLRCYGVPTVQTPHLDRLAAEGVLLEQCSAASPICSPSRGAMLTGRWPQRNGLLGLTHHGFRLHPDEVHLAARLRAAGYSTTLFHFQHVAEREAWPRLGFDEFLLPSRDEEEPVYPHMARPAAEVGDGVAAWLHTQAARPDRATRPFFAQVNFNETHTPFWFGGADPARLDGVTLPPWIAPSPAAEDHFAHLQGSVAALDAGIGRILDALDAAGLAENTLVLYATDHGLEAARDKWTCFESGLGIAAIARLPAAGISDGRRLATPVSNIDFAPTLLELAGVPTPAELDGRSLVPLLRGALPDDPESAPPVFALYHNGGSRSVRHGRWKLIRNLSAEPYGETAPVSLRGDHGPRLPRPPAELYDLATDPHELHNLADVHPDTVARLSALLGAWMHEVRDPACITPYPSSESPLTQGCTTRPLRAAPDSLSLPPLPLSIMPPATTPSRRGFTLIELLTVIAIIGILAAIIIPTVGKVRQSARTSNTVSNVRQIGALLNLYANDNRQLWPYTNGGYWSKDALYPYLTGRPVTPGTPIAWNDLADTIFVSPSSSDIGGTDGPGQPAIVDHGNRGFAMNAALPDSGVNPSNTRPKVPGKIATLSRTAVVMDSNSKQIFAGLGREQYTTWVENRHGKRNAVLFADGHTELVPHADIPVINSGTPEANTFWFGR